MHTLEHLSSLQKAKITQLNKKKIFSVEDLAETFPRDYIDMRTLSPIHSLSHGEWGSAYGKVIKKRANSRCYYVVMQRRDKSQFKVTWFNNDLAFRAIEVGEVLYLCGKVNIWNREVGFTCPFVISKDKNRVLKIHPIYRKNAGISESFMLSKIQDAINFMKTVPEPIEKTQLANQLGVTSYIKALTGLHTPKKMENIEEGTDRMDFEKMYRFYSDLNKKSPFALDESISILEKTAGTRNFIDNILPYELTKGQVQVISAFFNKVNRKERVNSLVSGDVGCGKTVVAMIYALLMVENGHQVAVMAPTIVLARQHYEEFSRMMESVTLNGKPVVVEFLTGKTKVAQRKKILKDASDGTIDILIGTHAVASENVFFSNLGLIIVDEEHKFGVVQKTKILDFNPSVHYTSMTATPIPRSIGLSLYGNDVELLPITSLPTGRKTIITKQFFEHKPMFDEVMAQIQQGHQAYIIAPLIDKSESEKMVGVLSVEEAEAMFSGYLEAYHPSATCRIATINGRMTEDEVAAGIDSFANKEAEVLISTTIVEVGVNVPNATAICILSAGRFGLAALHQLRGRVGRNSDQGYCFLLEERRTERLDVICLETNGFKIAEEDLRLRGPGDLVGESQKGLSEVIDIILAKKEIAHTINQSFQSNPT